MRKFCEELPGPKMINLLEGGKTPIFPPDVLEEMGFKLAAYPVTLLASAVKAMIEALVELKTTGKVTPEQLISFDELKKRIGFDEYFVDEKNL